MSAISLLNPKAQVNSSAQALSFNISAAKGLQDVLKTNLGPKGTMKMLVSGSGDIKITKDGNVLLHEMQIQHPTASMVARTATAQDDTTGDGTTSTVLLIGELLRQAELYLVDGLHPRLIAEGFEKAKDIALDELTKFALAAGSDGNPDREKLIQVARTALRTKIHQQTADLLTEICVDSVDCIRKPGEKDIDLHMVEIMTMQHRQDLDSVLVKGLVLDHGARHPDMKKRANNCYILTCNVSLEYEKTEVNSAFFYKSAEERERLAKSEHEFINLRVQKIIDLKKEMLEKDPEATLVVINQNGIDPESLDKLAKEGIIALRRAKRRNMERLTLACGGTAVNSVDEQATSTSTSLARTSTPLSRSAATPPPSPSSSRPPTNTPSPKSRMPSVTVSALSRTSTTTARSFPVQEPSSSLPPTKSGRSFPTSREKSGWVCRRSPTP